MNRSTIAKCSFRVTVGRANDVEAVHIFVNPGAAHLSWQIKLKILKCLLKQLFNDDLRTSFINW